MTVNGEDIRHFPYVIPSVSGNHREMPGHSHTLRMTV